MQKESELSVYIGEMLRKRRIYIGLTGRQLGERLRISQQQISRYETGVTSISLNKLYYYLANLDMSPDEMSQFVYKITVFFNSQKM